MPTKQPDKVVVRELNAVLDWLRSKADPETGLAPVRSAQTPGGQQQTRYDVLKLMQLIRFDSIATGWQVLDFEHTVTLEDYLRVRAAWREARQLTAQTLARAFS